MRCVFQKDLEVILEVKCLDAKAVFMHAHNIKPLQVRSIVFGHPEFPPLKAL
jgi:hypothetical protein